MSLARTLPFAVVAALAIFAGRPARAEMLVLESTDTRYQRGQYITAEQAAALQPGTYVKALDGTVTKLFGISDATSGLQIGGVRGFKRKPPQQ